MAFGCSKRNLAQAALGVVAASPVTNAATRKDISSFMILENGSSYVKIRTISL